MQKTQFLAAKGKCSLEQFPCKNLTPKLPILVWMGTVLEGARMALLACDVVVYSISSRPQKLDVDAEVEVVCTRCARHGA